MTINDYLEAYSGIVRYRGHTPGHKGKLDGRDVTEIGDEFPSDLIEKAERRTAEVYRAHAVRYLTGGSSMGIKAAVLADKRSFVTDGYCHRAVEEAARLADVECYKMPIPLDTKTDLPEMPTAESVLNEMRNWQTKVALIQYPDYYGRCCDLTAIYSAIMEKNGVLIVDSAHGAHFALRPDLFPRSAIRSCDICNMSAHKTLGAYTQTAYLAISSRFDIQAVDEALANLGTTSPNYILLGSLEYASLYGTINNGDYDRLKKFSDKIRRAVPCLKNDDFTRLCVDFGRGNAKTAYDKLHAQGVIAEKFDDRYVVFILTPFDTDEELDVLYSEVKKLF